MKITEVSRDHAYARRRGWLGPDGAFAAPGDATALTTDETDVDLVLHPDGTGGVEWGADDTGVTVEDEGTPLATTATTLDFVGSGVTATGSGATKTITIPGTSALPVQEDGSTVVAVPTSLDFRHGLDVTASGASARIAVDETELTGSLLPASLTVKDEGSALSTLASTLDFVGAGVTATGTGATKTITIPGATAGNDITGNDVLPPQAVAMPPWVKPTGSGNTITADAQGRITVVNSTTYKAFPGLTYLEGRLHCVYRDGSAHNSAGGVVKWTYSDDLGRTWSTPATIASPTGTEDLRDPCITALSTGRLLLTYHPTGTGGTVALRVEAIYSDNRGVTWSSPYVLPTTFSGRTAASSAPLELPNGTILQAVYGQSGGNFFAAVLFSTDGGLTFGSQTTIASSGSRDYDEPQIRLLASGKIVCLLRTDTSPNHTWRTYSTDGGLTWSAATDVLAYGGGRPDFVEFFPGCLFLVTRNDATNNDGRWFVSWDEGATWGTAQELDSGVTTDELYAGIVCLTPGYIAVVYSLENSSSDADIYLRYYHDGYGIDPLGNLTVLSGGGGGVTGFAAPALTLGTTNTAGAATTVLATDSTIAAFDATTPASIGTAATGSVAKAARRDHVHATGAGTPTTSAIGDAAATGTGPAAAMTDHVHGREALSTATPLVESGPGAVGTGTKSSREDHVHPAAAGGTDDHIHIVGEAQTGDGSTTVFILAQEAIPGTIAVYNTAGARVAPPTLGGANDQITLAAAPTAGTFYIDYIPLQA